MNAINLLNPDGTPSTVWQCAKCKKPDNEMFANRCCRCKCGADIMFYEFECKTCEKSRYDKSSIVQHERMVQRLNKAEKIEINVNDLGGWDGPVYTLSDDKYFFSVEHYLESIHGKHDPQELWAAAEIPFELCVEGMIESALDMHHDDADNLITDSEMKRLKDFVSEWASVQPIKSFKPDYTKAIVFVGDKNEVP